MKSCRHCTSPPIPRLRLCISHFQKREEAKKLEREKREAKKIKKLYTITGRKKLKKKAEALVRLYVRKRAVDFSGNIQCFTCLKRVPFEKTNAGHFRHGKLDLDTRNLRPQCVTCNLYKSGELGRYAIRLIEEQGKEWVDQLNQDADRDTGQHTTEFLLETIEKYKELLKKL